MRSKLPLVALVALSLMTVGLPAVSAADAPRNAEETVEGEEIPLQGGVTSPIYIMDDNGNDYYPARTAAENLGLQHEFTTNACSVADAAQSGEYDMMVVTSQLYSMSFCDASVFNDLADYVENGGYLVLTAWEYDLCGGGGFFSYPCSAESVDNVLAALGVERPLNTHFSAPTLTTSDNLCTDTAVPNLFAPNGGHTIEPTSDHYIRVAQGVSVADDTATKCLNVDGNADDAQIVASPNGVYVGPLPTNYENADGDGDSRNDFVELYEDVLTNGVVKQELVPLP